MPTLEAMRRRIETAEDLRGVVRVMKALAAVNIRQYEKAVASLTRFSHTLDLGFRAVLKNHPEILLRPGPSVGRRLGAIVVGTDQGMCGSFNEQIAGHALQALDALVPRAERVLITVGSRPAGRLQDAGEDVQAVFGLPASVPALTQVVRDILFQVEAWRFRDGIERLVLFHHRPLGGAGFRPLTLQLLPLDLDRLRELHAQPWPTRQLPTFTQPWGRLFSGLVRRHLFVSLYRPLAESLAAENASRLAAMQAAEKNIEDHLERLHAHYHQQRQADIMNELLDIVSGFETLTQGETPAAQRPL